MPAILCSWCQYVGQGDDFDDKIADVEEHEEKHHAEEIAEELK